MNRMFPKHINDGNPVTCFLDQYRTEVVERFWGVEIETFFYLFE